MVQLKYQRIVNSIFSIGINLTCLIASPFVFNTGKDSGVLLNCTFAFLCVALTGASIFQFVNVKEKSGFILAMMMPIVISLIVMSVGKMNDLVLSLLAIGFVSLVWNLEFLRKAKLLIFVLCLILGGVLYLLPNSNGSR